MCCRAAVPGVAGAAGRVFRAGAVPVRRPAVSGGAAGAGGRAGRGAGGGGVAGPGVDGADRGPAPARRAAVRAAVPAAGGGAGGGDGTGIADLRAGGGGLGRDHYQGAGQRGEHRRFRPARGPEGRPLPAGAAGDADRLRHPGAAGGGSGPAARQGHRRADAGPGPAGRPARGDAAAGRPELLRLRPVDRRCRDRGGPAVAGHGHGEPAPGPAAAGRVLARARQRPGRGDPAGPPQRRAPPPRQHAAARDGPLPGITVRVIEFRLTVTTDDERTRTEGYRLITTLLDYRACPAAALAAGYARRRAIETGLREFKTYLRGPGRILRSRTPELARQELWAYLIIYQAIRVIMSLAAAGAGTSPDRISFTAALHAVRRTLPAG